MKRFLIVAGGTAAGILLALFIVMVFVLHACGSAMEAMKSDNSTADTPTVNAGANFDVGGLAISNIQVQAKDDLGGDGFIDTKAKGIFVVVTAHVTNNGNKAHDLNSMFQKLYIGDKEYTANPFADVGTSSHMKTSVDPDPGFSDDVTFVFDVPQSSLNIGSSNASFTEKTVLDVSGGLDGEKPNEVKVVLSNGG